MCWLTKMIWLLKCLDNDYYVCGIYIDVQKTFNIVNHDILFAILNTVVSWIS